MKFNEISNYFNTLNNVDARNLNISFAVPSIFLLECKKLSKFEIFAQDVEYFEYGSNTGRLSYQHLIDNNIDGSIIGHSEQRRFNDNTDEVINNKIKKLLDNNLNIILCIGEPKEIYEKNETIEYLYNQLELNLKNINLDKNKIIIAYEPIWSIGTGLIPNNEYIFNIVKKIKEKYDLNILYGGSVNKNNISKLMEIKNIDGFLIGSGSINPNDFLEMIKIYNK